VNKSSKHLDNAPWRQLVPPERLLFLLKMYGPQTAQELGPRLAITAEAVRQQVNHLIQVGLVAAESRSTGVGRPALVYRLTSAAQKRFPDTHAELTAQLLASIQNTLGTAALDRLIKDRESHTLQRYQRALAGLNSLRARVARLAEIRSAEGYMAEWREEKSSFVLIENHCPICVAAAACQGFCRAELAIFQQVLGPAVDVARSEHLLEGSRRCVYLIAKKKTLPRKQPASLANP
jgi:predicted ArsR family transcriptional regulator